MNTEQITILGTGNAMVTKCYNTCFAIRVGENFFLVDAGGGNGILSQMEKAMIPFSKINNMFVTHAHTDHVMGVVWVIRKIASLINSGKYDGVFNIYCHGELESTIKIFCRLTLTNKLLKCLDNTIIFTPVGNDDTHSILGMKITFFDILSTKMKQYGFRAIMPSGKVVVCLGDEPYNADCEMYVDKCDWLLSEAFCLFQEKDVFKPYEKHHSTALDAGRLAESLKVKNLVLYHTEDSSLSTRKKRYTAEAKQEFSGNVYVPNDLEIITII